MRALFPVLALVLGALSLAPSWAHLLEAPPRIGAWPPELWREATVFHGQFAYFALVGAPVDLLAILVAGILALTFRNGPGARTTGIAALLFLAALGVWLGVVAPANAVLATWRPGPLPADFAMVRDRWEYGHIAIAAIKLVAFASLALAVASRLRPASVDRAVGARPHSKAETPDS